MTYLEEIILHAKEGSPQEVCGLVVSAGKRIKIIRGVNVDKNPRQHFTMGADVWLDVADDEEVVGIYHSHPVTSAQPSMHDLVMCEASGLPWHIVNPETQDHRVITPSGYVAPYENRPYVYGVFDCYTVGKDWYTREWGLVMPDVKSEYGWWDRGENLYLDHYQSAGFIPVPLESAYQIGDCLLIQHGAPVPNHMAVYMGESRILHHLDKRASKMDFYGGTWMRSTTHRLRHHSRMNHG